ncbi:MAG: substrate-binding domain-containing protein [Verrucomicrobia bacterium]|nr:substrate-binding domain-containing protein [Verrucomicrobiota bacterium]
MSKFNLAIAVGLQNAFGQRIIKGIKNYSTLHPEWSLCIVQPDLLKDPGFVARNHIDGIVLHLDNDALHSAVTSCGRPFVNVSNRAYGVEVTTVTSDDYAIGDMVAHYFLNRGYRNFAFLASKRKLSFSQRCDGFKATVEKKGWFFREHWVEKPTPTDYYDESERSRLLQFLEKLPRPCALMTSSDRYGSYLVDFCCEHGFLVPEDFAIMSVDNDELKCTICKVPLSSVLPGVEMIGFRAAKTLNDLAKKEITPGGRIHIPPVQIIERASTEHFSVADINLADTLQMLYQNLENLHGVEDIARKLNVSRRTLERRWQKELGGSPLTELRKLRLRKAKELLLNTRMPCKEVASHVGLPDNRSLTMLFQQLEGTTPSGFRKVSLPNPGNP